MSEHRISGEYKSKPNRRYVHSFAFVPNLYSEGFISFRMMHKKYPATAQHRIPCSNIDDEPNLLRLRKVIIDKPFPIISFIKQYELVSVIT